MNYKVGDTYNGFRVARFEDSPFGRIVILRHPTQRKRTERNIEIAIIECVYEVDMATSGSEGMAA